MFWFERSDLLCGHSNGDIFTCEDNILFSHVKISSFRAKAHLVFHWCLYNKGKYLPDSRLHKQKFPRFRNPDFLTRGDKFFSIRSFLTVKESNDDPVVADSSVREPGLVTVEFSFAF